MKKLFLLLTLFAAVSCSKEDDSEPQENNKQLVSFEEPYVKFGATESEVADMFGEDYTTHSSYKFDNGYYFRYSSETPGVFSTEYEFNIYNDLRETRVNYYEGNLEPLRNALQKKYGEPTINESSLKGTTYRYKTEDLNVTLEYANSDSKPTVTFN